MTADRSVVVDALEAEDMTTADGTFLQLANAFMTVAGMEAGKNGKFDGTVLAYATFDIESRQAFAVPPFLYQSAQMLVFLKS